MVERLVLEHQVRVRVMLRSLGRASRFASLPVEYRKGDVTDRAAFTEAARGCGAVIHCASRMEPDVPPERTSTCLGAQMAVRACAEVGARLVHISSCAVYGIPKAGEADEMSPVRPRHRNDRYALAKIAAERFLKLFAREHSLPAVILQPTIIYGPHSEEWTVAPLSILRSANIAMPQTDSSVCNAVYVDDVVTGAFLALDACDDTCQSYLINGNDLPTWSEFLSRHSAFGTKGRVVPLSQEGMERLKQESKKDGSLLRAVQRLLRERREVRSEILSTTLVGGAYGLLRKYIPKRTYESIKLRFMGNPPLGLPVVELPRAEELPLRLPSAHFLEFATQSFHYSSAKAQRDLGYVPQYSLNKAFGLIAAWARWSRLLP